MIRDFLIGLTALLGMVGLVIMLILFGELKTVTEKHYEFGVLLSNASGISSTSPVTLDGVKIGQVTRIESVPGSGARVMVRVMQGVRVPRVAPISIERGFVGDASMEFRSVALSESQRADGIQPGEVVNGGNPKTLLGNIEELVKGPIEKLGGAAENIEQVADEYKKLGERLNDMVEPRTLADVAGGKQPNLRSTLERIDKAVASADKWLGDEELRLTAKELVARASRVVDQAQELTAAWTQTAKTVESEVAKVGGEASKISASVQDLGADAKNLLADARGVLTRAQGAADELSGTLEKISNGKGTAGKLISDPALYENLNEAAKRLDSALSQAEQLIEKYKAEGIRLKL